MCTNCSAAASQPAADTGHFTTPAGQSPVLPRSVPVWQLPPTRVHHRRAGDGPPQTRWRRGWDRLGLGRSTRDCRWLWRGRFCSDKGSTCREEAQQL